MTRYGNPTPPPPYYDKSSVGYAPRPVGWPPPRASSSLVFVGGQAGGTGNGTAWHRKGLAHLRASVEGRT